MGTGAIKVTGKHLRLILISSSLTWTGALVLWLFLKQTIPLWSEPPAIAITTIIIAAIEAIAILGIRFNLNWKQWIIIWIAATPWTLASITLFSQLPLLVILPILITTWSLMGIWGIYRFYP